MPAGGGSAIDPYTLAQFAAGYDPYRAVAGKTLVQASSIPTSGLGIYVFPGQSNNGNTAPTAYTAINSTKIYQLSIYDGGIYRAADPLIGATLVYGPGHVATRFADAMVTAGVHANVLVVPLAISGSDFGQWATGGIYNHRIGVTQARMQTLGLVPTAILNQQGEGDQILGTSAANVTTRIQSIIANWRAASGWSSVPFFQSLTGYWGTGTDATRQANVRAGEAALVNSGSLIFQGPDTDTLTGLTYRQSDNVHFNDTGNAAHASMWVAAVRGVLGI